MSIMEVSIPKDDFVRYSPFDNDIGSVIDDVDDDDDNECNLVIDLGYHSTSISPNLESSSSPVQFSSNDEAGKSSLDRSSSIAKENMEDTQIDQDNLCQALEDINEEEDELMNIAIIPSHSYSVPVPNNDELPLKNSKLNLVDVSLLEKCNEIQNSNDDRKNIKKCSLSDKIPQEKIKSVASVIKDKYEFNAEALKALEDGELEPGREENSNDNDTDKAKVCKKAKDKKESMESIESLKALKAKLRKSLEVLKKEEEKEKERNKMEKKREKPDSEKKKRRYSEEGMGMEHERKRKNSNTKNIHVSVSGSLKDNKESFQSGRNQQKARWRPSEVNPSTSRKKSPKSSVPCAHFKRGKCHKLAGDCKFSHDTPPQKIMELCKFWMMDCCAKKLNCLYLHNDFPCKYFHTGLVCKSGDKCKFTHGPLNEQTKLALLKHLEQAPKEILGDFPRLTRDQAIMLINKKEGKFETKPQQQQQQQQKQKQQQSLHHLPLQKQHESPPHLQQHESPPDLHPSFGSGISQPESACYPSHDNLHGVNTLKNDSFQSCFSQPSVNPFLADPQFLHNFQILQSFGHNGFQIYSQPNQTPAHFLQQQSQQSTQSNFCQDIDERYAFS